MVFPGEFEITLENTKLQTNKLAPYKAPIDISVPPSSPPATIEEITSGAPLARASRVTPVKASENLNRMERRFSAMAR